jgi:thymidylate synthase
MPRPFREVFGASVVVEDPAACLVTSSARPVREGWIYAQWLRLLDGSDDPVDFRPYQQRAHEFADGTGRLRGAFGYRLRVESGDQLQAAIELLRHDPSTRRAFLSIARATDVLDRPRDFPCAAAVHLRLRGNKLLAMTTMRSQSALLLFPYDGALFCLLQLWVAAALGVEPGPHRFSFGSLHVYADELPRAEAFVGEEPTVARVSPMTSPDEALERLLRWERLGAHADALPPFSHGSFWARAVRGLLDARASVIA